MAEYSNGIRIRCALCDKYVTGFHTITGRAIREAKEMCEVIPRPCGRHFTCPTCMKRYVKPVLPIEDCTCSGCRMRIDRDRKAAERATKMELARV